MSDEKQKIIQVAVIQEADCVCAELYALDNKGNIFNRTLIGNKKAQSWDLMPPIYFEDYRYEDEDEEEDSE
jgi:hypothetical protein